MDTNASSEARRVPQFPQKFCNMSRSWNCTPHAVQNSTLPCACASIGRVPAAAPSGFSVRPLVVRLGACSDPGATAVPFLAGAIGFAIRVLPGRPPPPRASRGSAGRSAHTSAAGSVARSPRGGSSPSARGVVDRSWAFPPGRRPRPPLSRGTGCGRPNPPVALFVDVLLFHAGAASAFGLPSPAAAWAVPRGLATLRGDRPWSCGGDCASRPRGLTVRRPGGLVVRQPGGLVVRQPGGLAVRRPGAGPAAAA